MNRWSQVKANWKFAKGKASFCVLRSASKVAEAEASVLKLLCLAILVCWEWSWLWGLFKYAQFFQYFATESKKNGTCQPPKIDQWNLFLQVLKRHSLYKISLKFIGLNIRKTLSLFRLWVFRTKIKESQIDFSKLHWSSQFRWLS